MVKDFKKWARMEIAAEKAKAVKKVNKKAKIKV
jgi:hypothetical protein